MLHLHNTAKNDIKKEKEVIRPPLEELEFSPSSSSESGNTTSRDELIIAESLVKSTKEISAMSNGFIRIPRSFLQDSAIQSLPIKQYVLLMKLIELAAWKDINIFCEGKYVLVQRNQVFYSLRYIVESHNECKRHPEDHVSKNDVERLIRKLVTLNFVRQEVRQRRMLLTLCFLDVLDEKNCFNETTCETPVRQDRDNFETNKKKEKKEKKEKNITRAPRAAPSADALALAEALFSSIQKWKPNFLSPDMQKWGHEMQKILKNYSQDRILSVVAWLPENDFWRKNVLSPSKLHKQFERLETEIQSDATTLQTKKNIKFFMECKKDNPELLKHALLKGNYIIFGNTGKDLSINMSPNAFEEAFLNILGARYA